MHPIPASVLARVIGAADATATRTEAVRLTGGMGAATGEVHRLTVDYRAGGLDGTVSVIRKTLRPAGLGRHALAARSADHWAYWRREPLAYSSSFLPAGPGLRAPVCFAATEEAVYLEDVVGPPESPRTAARRLGAWQTSTPIPDVPWLAGHQLAQRLAVTDLDWTMVDIDPRVVRLWERRDELMAALEDVPQVITHGDFHPGNTVAHAGDTVVLDWGAFGVAPIGADLAHLMLASREDLTGAYLEGARERLDPDALRTGTRVTAALTGASRVHWMSTGGHPVPDGYIDFIVACGE